METVTHCAACGVQMTSGLAAITVTGELICTICATDVYWWCKGCMAYVPDDDFTRTGYDDELIGKCAHCGTVE